MGERGDGVAVEMDGTRFDAFTRNMRTRLERRHIFVGAVAGIASLQSLIEVDAKKKGKKGKRGKKKAPITVCLNGQTLTVPASGSGALLSQGAVTGACAPVSPPASPPPSPPVSPPPPHAPICDDKNWCVDRFSCGEGNCNCWVRADNEQHICGGATRNASSCEECPSDLVCVNGGIGNCAQWPFLCVTPCTATV